MKRLHISLLLSAMLGFAGCCGTTNTRSGYQQPPRLEPLRPVRPPCDRCATPNIIPPRFNPAPGPMVAPPGAPAVAAPPPSPEIQQNAFQAPAQPSPPASPPPTGGAAGVYLAPPEPAPAAPTTPPPSAPPANNAAPPREQTRLYAPQTTEPPAAPPARDDRAASPALPVDIPQFAIARPNVATGLEPYPDGVSWLKSHGYRNVLHVRAPGEDDSAARRRFEQGGLRYLSLELSPQSLTREVVEQFSRTVNDTSNQPLFVYDRDGSLAGGLWYLHFRLSDRVSDEKARADAAQIGFKQDQEGPHKTMWVAVQSFLEKINP